MYNPEGADSGREWIEVYNTGDESIDLINYRFLENDVAHRLSPHNPDDTGLLLEPQKYAIIADNSTKFLEDYSENELLIDSVFSLKNTGEELSIVNPDGEIIYTVTYDPEWGADGTGSSLQNTNLSSSSDGGLTTSSASDWIPAQPTPFLENATSADDQSDQGDSDDGSGADSGGGSSAGSGTSSGTKSTHSGISDLSNYKPKVDLKVSAGRNRYALVNSEIDFHLEHNQSKGSGIKALWSMGDGKQLRGDEISYSYNSAGVYNVVLKAVKGQSDSTARTKVFVSNPEINLDYSKSGKTVDVLLKNTLKQEINIGRFTLVFEPFEVDTDEKIVFKIAEDTILDPEKTLVLTGEVTNFPYKKGEIKFYYPNRKKYKQINIETEEKTLDLNEISEYVNSDRRNDFEEIINIYELYMK